MVHPLLFWKVSAATVQLDNMTVAYALPKEWLKIIGISSCRFNLTCQNVFNFLNPYPEGAWRLLGREAMDIIRTYVNSR